MNRIASTLLMAAATLAVSTAAAHAAGGGLPWESPMTQVLNSLTGPVAKFAAVGVIMLTGIAFAVSESGTVMKKALGAVFGLSIMLGATSWGLSFFGFSGGAVMPIEHTVDVADKAEVSQ